MPRRSLIAVLLVALLAPAGAAAQSETRQLMPGVTYKREVRWVNGGPLVVHSLLAPPPGGAYQLKPVLSNDLVTGRERVTTMQRRISRTATAAGVNGDFFTWSTGHPSGIVMREGVLHTSPSTDRSSLGIGSDGLLRVERITFFGSIQVDGAARMPVVRFNRPLTGAQIGLFTSAWGLRTPRVAGALDVVVSGAPPTSVDAELTGQVVQVRRGGGTAIPAGAVVVQAAGFWADRLAAQTRAGSSLTAVLTLKPWWDAATEAIGGGPVLVENGRVAAWRDEGFTAGQLTPRNARTAVGQRRDGRILLVAVDARRAWSNGLRVSELALEMIRLGAETAMALDAGGSTTMAFDGRVLNRPSAGAERPVSDALMVLYSGAYVPEPALAVVSPNGDGVAEQQRLAYKIVRPSTVSARLVGPDGEAIWEETGDRQPGTYALAPVSFPAEGRYRFVVEATDSQGGRTGMTRAFAVNNTLGFLRLSSKRLRVKRKQGGKLTVSFELANPAGRLAASVLDRNGKVVRTLYRGANEEPGMFVLVWDGKNGRRAAVAPGAYTIRVRAVNGHGPVVLEQKLAVARAAQAAKTRR